MTDDLKKRLHAVCETSCDPDLPFAVAERIEELEAERDELLTDAERYRWLRKFLSTKDLPILTGRGERDEQDERDTMDWCVDAAIAAARKGQR